MKILIIKSVSCARNKHYSNSLSGRCMFILFKVKTCALGTVCFSGCQTKSRYCIGTKNGN